MTPYRQVRDAYDVTTIRVYLAHRVGDAVARNDLDAAALLLPDERPYPLPADIADRLEATPEPQT